MPTDKLKTALGEAVAASWGRHFPPKWSRPCSRRQYDRLEKALARSWQSTFMLGIPAPRLATSRGGRCPSPAWRIAATDEHSRTGLDPAPAPLVGGHKKHRGGAPAPCLIAGTR